VAVGRGTLAKLWVGAALAGVVAGVTRWLLAPALAAHPLAVGMVALLPYGGAYFGIAWLWGVAPARDLGRSLALRWGTSRNR
jgi:hypothetical protein